MITIHEPYQAIKAIQFTDTADNGALEKVDSAFVLNAGRLGIRDIHFRVVPVYDTRDIGIHASEQINSAQRPEILSVSVNCAGPDKEEGTIKNARNDFFFAVLPDSVFVQGTSNGFEFSYVKPLIQEFYRLTTTNNLGTPFRSCEVLPEHALRFLVPQYRQKLIDSGALERVENIDSIVPSVPNKTHVFEVDQPFQNVKLFLSSRNRKRLQKSVGQEVRLYFGAAAAEFARHKTCSARSSANYITATVTEHLFDGKIGQNVIALNSSSRLTPGLSTGENVPILATMRKNPATTLPKYQVPEFGAIIAIGVETETVTQTPVRLHATGTAPHQRGSSVFVSTP